MNMPLQTIRNSAGRPEYVLLPISAYELLKQNINSVIKQTIPEKDYVDFDPADFIKNKIALARMKAKITQIALSKYLNVSQAYISKIENDDYKVSDKLFAKVINAINNLKSQPKKSGKPI